MKILFIDKNKSLVEKVKTAIKHIDFCDVSTKYGDIFNEKGIIVSASNPQFTFGGGLDAHIKDRFPKTCSAVNPKKGNQRIDEVIFTITVDEELKATKALVKSALLFALSKCEKDETLLISGLGTGIGGLDEDVFVHLFLESLCEFYNVGWGIKFVKKDGTDFRTGKVLYKAGKELEQKDAPKDGEDCGVGLHLGKDFIGAGNYHMPEKIFFCAYDLGDVCGKGNDKVRISKLKVLCELPQWLGYGPKGKKIVSKIGYKINPEDYNPYQTDELPSKETIKTMKLAQVRDQVGDQVKAQVWDQVGDQVWDQVMAQVGAQVKAQVWAQVGDQVWAQVGDQVGDQVWDRVGVQVKAQVWARVRDQVWAQVRATSYWAINIHFELGISHWFGDFLKLGVMPIFLDGKVKFFGRKGKYLGEYSEAELFDN